MTIELRIPDEADWPHMLAMDGRTFGSAFTQEAGEEARGQIDLSRFRILIDTSVPEAERAAGTHVAGIAGSYDFEVALPGGAAVPMAGVTWVSVGTTYRRQGLLRRLIAAVHADVDERGEPLATLYASQAGIYERFGYGVATRRTATRIDTSAARIAPRFEHAVEPVRVVHGDTADRHIDAVWDHAWRACTGEVRRSPEHRAVLAARRLVADGGGTDGVTLAHADGYVTYRVASHWNEGYVSHELRITEMVAPTLAARVSLWNAVLSTDLVATVVSRQLAVDDPLPLLLTDPRALRTEGLTDGVWAHVRDVRVAFGARTYGTDDRLVIECEGKRWSIEQRDGEVEVRGVRTRPDLVVEPGALGPLLYGGIKASWLALGERVSGRDEATLGRADRFFVTGRMPHCQTAY
jgi:predicted acetyltransferase